jgi:glycerate kinase
MKILIVPDKFKHSLSTFQVIDGIREGFKQASDSFDIIGLPMADGGDHFSEVMAYYTNAQKHEVEVSDPLFRPVRASYYIKDHTAIVEMAKASGLQLLAPSEYNCAQTSTYGVGQIIGDALEHGVSELILGIGGSATNDCGIGMAAALGYRFLDRAGNEVKPTGGNMIHIEHVEAPYRTISSAIKITVATDVSNFLTGPMGAATVYAPQKGATPEMVQQLEEGALHLAAIVQRDLGISILDIEGGGAAGGLGAGCVAFLKAVLVNGSELVFTYSQAEKHISEADVVITGEGKIDQQSLHGKLLYSLSAICKKYHKPLFAFCGTLDVTPQQLEALGVTAAFSIISKPMCREETYQHAANLLEQTAYNVGRIMIL